MRYLVNSFKNLIGCVLVLLMFFSLSCATWKELPAGGLQTTPVTKAGDKSQVTMQEPWEVEWGKTLEQAKKERSVVIYAIVSVSPAIKEVLNLFKEKYAISLDVISFGRGGEQSARLFSERSRGLYLADIFISGMNTTVGSIKQEGALDPMEPSLILPEVIDPKLWYGARLPWGDRDRKIFNYLLYPVSPIATNTQMAKPEDIKSYYDLLAPRWKGKIIINDPTMAGTSFNSFSSSILNKALDQDYFQQLVKHEPVVLRDQRLQIDWLAKGKYPIALWPRDPELIDYQKAGAPIDFIPTLKEGFYLATGGSALSLVNRAPHPNAAKVFINWLLSREGQKQIQGYVKAQSAREDIPTEGVLNIRRPGEKYLLSANASEDWLLKEQDRYIDMAKQIFSPLVK